jgi:hypothetical protein
MYLRHGRRSGPILSTMKKKAESPKRIFRNRTLSRPKILFSIGYGSTILQGDTGNYHGTSQRKEGQLGTYVTKATQECLHSTLLQAT